MYFQEYEQDATNPDLYLMTRTYFVVEEGTYAVFELKEGDVMEFFGVSNGIETSYVGSYSMSGNEIRVYDDEEELMFVGTVVEGAIEIDLMSEENADAWFIDGLYELAEFGAVEIEGNILTIYKQAA